MEDNRTWWQKLKWKLFGEIKIFYWLFGLIMFGSVAMAIAITYLLFHFINKYW